MKTSVSHLKLATNWAFLNPHVRTEPYSVGCFSYLSHIYPISILYLSNIYPYLSHIHIPLWLHTIDSHFLTMKKHQTPIKLMLKSAHTALAVKACLLGGNSNTKCSMTFVNIAVAISALAGGGQKRFRTETRIRWCFRHFSRIFGCLSARGY